MITSQLYLLSSYNVCETLELYTHAFNLSFQSTAWSVLRVTSILCMSNESSDRRDRQGQGASITSVLILAQVLNSTDLSFPTSLNSMPALIS